MFTLSGEILHLRFANVRSPAFIPGYIDRVIPETGMGEAEQEDFYERLDRWVALMYEQHGDNLDALELPPNIVVQDLVAYYGGREEEP